MVHHDEADDISRSVERKFTQGVRMSKIGAWFNEPEFNRWYFKWSLSMDRAGIAVIAIKLSDHPFQHNALAFLLGVLAV